MKLLGILLLLGGAITSVISISSWPDTDLHARAARASEILGRTVDPAGLAPLDTAGNIIALAIGLILVLIGAAALLLEAHSRKATAKPF